MTKIQLVDGKGFVDIDDPKNQPVAAVKPEELVQQTNTLQSQVMARLEALPNFDKQVAALSKAKNFKDLGETLQPLILTKNSEETRPLSTQVQAIAKTELKEKKSVREELGGIFAFLLPGGNNDAPEPAPQPIDNPLVCTHCGAKLQPKWTRCNMCGAPVMLKQQYTTPKAVDQKHRMGLLDLVAGAFVTVIWFAASGWILQSFILSWGLVIELAMFWVFWIIVFRLMIGGILD